MSSSEQDRVRELAERVARRLSDEPAQGDAGGASESGSIVDESDELAALHIGAHVAQDAPSAQRDRYTAQAHQRVVVPLHPPSAACSASSCPSCHCW